MYNEADNITQEVEKLKNGDESAFAMIYNQTYKYVYSRAKCMFSDEEEVQDLVQEVYLALYRNSANIQSSESIFGWLKTATFYQGTKMLQKKRKEVLLSEESEELFETIPGDEPQIEENYMNKEDVELIRECINCLSDEQKTVLLAYYYDNLKVNEISEILSVSEGTIKSRLHLARKNLRSHVEQEEKKRGYKLHSFGPVTLAMAIRALLQTNMERAACAEETVFVKLCEVLNLNVTKTIGIQSVVAKNVAKEVAKEGPKRLGKNLILKVAELGAKKVALSVTGIVAASAVTVGAVIGPNIEKAKEPELLPEAIENVQEEFTQETDTDEEVPSKTNTNDETDKQIEEVVSDKSEEPSVKKEPSTSNNSSLEEKPSTSDTPSVEETPSTSHGSSVEETPSTSDSPTVEEELKEETSSSSNTPSGRTEEETTDSSSQDSGNDQNVYDGTNAMAPDDGIGDGGTWDDSF